METLSNNEITLNNNKTQNGGVRYKIKSGGDVDEIKDEETQSKTSDVSTTKEILKGFGTIKQSLKSLSTIKRNTTEKDKNEPTRFLGEGVCFKAKLIGILEVEEARGDRMCQDALSELKMAVRAAGEHKQRISININLDGLRLRDEKTDSLFHHAVHKISFIAQDITDTRAFGYIYGSPDSGHKFFGIKTDKAASQVVMAMRDLFHVVYELKKREVELAKQNLEHQQQKYGSAVHLDNTSPSSSKSGSAEMALPYKVKGTKEDKGNKSKTHTAGVIADLMDLELELNSLQQGLHQMERFTPTEPLGPSPSTNIEDPFGDSFTPPPYVNTPPTAKLPPPPASGKKVTEEKRTLMKESAKQGGDMVSNNGGGNAKDLYDIFTELDPLGTGKSKPYVDKKDFFQELKNPPKKLLKDLVTNEISHNLTNSFDGIMPQKSSEPDDTFEPESFEPEFADFSSFECKIPERVSPQPCSKSPINQSDSSSSQGSGKNLLKTLAQSDTTITDEPAKQWAEEGANNGMQKIVINLRKVLSSADDTDKESDSPVMESRSFDNPRRRDSSDTADSIPEPPPRVVTSPIIAINAPPLPPKKNNVPVILKPPVRPPSAEAVSHYDYIENYGSFACRRTKSDDIKIPPIPAPARKPKFGGDPDIIRRRPPSKQSSSSEPEYYLTPIKKTVNTREIDTASPSLNNITLSQLTSTGINELAASLGLSATTLSTMTLKEITDCISKIQSKPEEPLTEKEPIKEPQTFNANFEDKFTREDDLKQNDKYAVFRELIDQDMASMDNTINEEVKEKEENSEVDTTNEKRVDTPCDSGSRPTSAVADRLEPQETSKEEEVLSDDGVGETTAKSSDERKSTLSVEETGRNWARFDVDQRRNSETDRPQTWVARSPKRSSGREPRLQQFQRLTLHPTPKPSVRRWNDDGDEDDDVYDDDDEDSEDVCETSNKKSPASSWEDSSWKENGWSDQDSLCGVSSSLSKRRQQQTKKKTQRKDSPRSLESSPQEEEEQLFQGRPVPRSKPKYYCRTFIAGYDKKFPDPADNGKEVPRKKCAPTNTRYDDYYPAERFSQRQISSNEFDYGDNASSNVMQHFQPRAKPMQQRPKSEDKPRKPGMDHSKVPQRRPYSHDELDISGTDEERSYRRTPRSPSSYSLKRSMRNRNRSQTSPFEDNFAPRSYDYPNSKIYAQEIDYRRKVTNPKHQTQPGRYMCPESMWVPEAHSYSEQDHSISGSRSCSFRRSPFEDDFLENRRLDFPSPDERQLRDQYYSPTKSDPKSFRSGKSDRSKRDHYRSSKDRKYYENVEINPKPSEEVFPSTKSDNRYRTRSSRSDNSVLSPRKMKSTIEHRDDPFKDNVKSYDGVGKEKRVARSNYAERSDSSEPSPEWNDDFQDFKFPENMK